MVVTRRQNSGPLPAAANRTNSTSGSSGPKGKGVDKTLSLKKNGLGPTHIPPNGIGPEVPERASVEDREVLSAHPPEPPPLKPSASVPKPRIKSKKPTKTKKRPSNQGISIFDILGRLFLLWFTIYSLSVCPGDVQLRSPVCHALTEYRRLVLEPFVYPPIRAALDHPSIAPHVQRAQPYYNRAAQMTKPWIRRGTYKWRTEVVPRIQWLQLRARPYVRRIERRYDATLGPYVRQASDEVAKFKDMAEPYILSAILKTRQKWTRAGPYVRPLLRGASHVPSILLRLIGRPLGDARRQWVDPQVAKIWAAVVEKGQADTTNAQTMTVAVSTSSTSTALGSESPTPTAALTPPLEDIATSTSDTVSISTPLPGPKDEAATSASSIVMDNASLTSSSISMAPEVSVSNISEPSSEGSPLVDLSVPESTNDAVVSASSVVQESTSQSSVTPSSTSSQISSEPSSTIHDSSLAVEDEDLEEFLAEMGLNIESPQPPPVPEEPVEQEDDEERLRLQAIETAEKRADIEGRHTQWEIDLQKLGKSQRKVVRATLNRMREAAAEEARAPGAAVRRHVEALLQEAEKSLKSLNAYTRKLAAEDKQEGEKIKTWESVVNKVEEKFDKRVEATADAIREWWGAYVNTEVGQVLVIAKEVEELANRAQSDIAMDYAWLPDVTYEDWQRYHDLVRTSKRFEDLYISMQNGTHKSAPANPLVDIMEALQEEVDDMVLGFEANLTRVKNVALDMFSGLGTKTAISVPEATAVSEPKASIPPIDTITAENKDGEIPPLILSRDAEEIQAAVSRAEEVRTMAVHEEL